MKTLVYTVSRADTEDELMRATGSLAVGSEWAGAEHEWILWANAPGIHRTELKGFSRWGNEENVGQHVALGQILDYARKEGYEFIVKVDDDVGWLSKNWLRKLIDIELKLFEASKELKPDGVWPVLGPRVRGLKHAVPVAEKLIISGIRIFVVPILGGLCRLHHISFFNTYVADVRRAMGAGGDTSVMLHSQQIEVPLMQTTWVRVQHKTKKMEDAYPEYFKYHSLFQSIPYIPVWRKDDAEKYGSGSVA